MYWCCLPQLNASHTLNYAKLHVNFRHFHALSICTDKDVDHLEAQENPFLLMPTWLLLVGVGQYKIFVILPDHIVPNDHLLDLSQDPVLNQLAGCTV